MARVLVLCTGNSARSQMAEGIARSIAPAGVRVYSAGSAPSSLNPHAVKAMREIGIDISGHRSKAIEAIPAGDIEAVITLCAEEVCPVFPGKVLRAHWPLADPAAEGETRRLEAFRRTRDELRRRIERLFAAPAG